MKTNSIVLFSVVVLICFLFPAYVQSSMTDDNLISDYEFDLEFALGFANKGYFVRLSEKLKSLDEEIKKAEDSGNHLLLDRLKKLAISYSKKLEEQKTKETSNLEQQH